jgi:hypothetical protein
MLLRLERVWPLMMEWSRCAGGPMVETTRWEWWHAEQELDRQIKRDEADSREGG